MKIESSKTSVPVEPKQVSVKHGVAGSFYDLLLALIAPYSKAPLPADSLQQPPKAIDPVLLNFEVPVNEEEPDVAPLTTGDAAVHIVPEIKAFTAPLTLPVSPAPVSAPPVSAAPVESGTIQVPSMTHYPRPQAPPVYAAPEMQSAPSVEMTAMRPTAVHFNLAAEATQFVSPPAGAMTTPIDAGGPHASRSMQFDVGKVAEPAIPTSTDHSVLVAGHATAVSGDAQTVAPLGAGTLPASIPLLRAQVPGKSTVSEVTLPENVPATTTAVREVHPPVQLKVSTMAERVPPAPNDARNRLSLTVDEDSQGEVRREQIAPSGASASMRYSSSIEVGHAEPLSAEVRPASAVPPVAETPAKSMAGEGPTNSPPQSTALRAPRTDSPEPSPSSLQTGETGPASPGVRLSTAPPVAEASLRALRMEVIAFVQSPNRPQVMLEIHPPEYGRVLVSGELGPEGAVAVRLVVETHAVKEQVLMHLQRFPVPAEVEVMTFEEYREQGESSGKQRREESRRQPPSRQDKPTTEFTV